MGKLNIVDLQIEVRENVYKSLDINQEVAFSFNLQAADLTNPTATKIPFSVQISIPKTQMNNDIFNQMGIIDSAILNFNPLLRTNFILYISNNVYQTGYMKMEEIHPREYKIRLFGGLGDYFYSMSEISAESGVDMRLKNLDFGTTFRHEINRTLLYNCWNGIRYNNSSGQDLRELLAYVPTYQGQYDNFNSDETVYNNQPEPQDVIWSNGQRVYTKPDLSEHRRSFRSNYSDTNQNGTLYFGEYRSYYQKPMIRFKELFLKITGNTLTNTPGIMNEQGWTTELDATFFNNFNPYWNDLWMLCQNYDTTDNSSGATRIALTGNLANPTNNPPNNPPIGTSYYDFYGPNVSGTASRKTKLNGQIKAKKAYTVNYNIFFEIQAVYARKGNGTPNKTMSINGSATWNAQLYIGGVAVPRAFVSRVNNDNTVARKEPRNFSGRRPYWNGSTALQPFTYFYRDNGEGAGEMQNSYDGTTLNMKGTWKITEQTFQTDPDEISVRFTFNGRTYWYRSSSGNDTNTRYYGIRLVLDTDNSEILIGDPENSGLRTGAIIDYKDIIKSNDTCLDLVLSYCKLFNLYFVKDIIEKKVTIMTRNSYFALQERLDWTNKIDYSKDNYDTPVPFDYKIGVLKYNDLGTKYEDEYRAEQSSDYGSVRINTGYQFSDVENNLLEGIIFDNCIIAQPSNRYYLGRNETVNRDNKVLPFLEDNSGSTVDNGFILLFNNGSQLVEANGSTRVPMALTDDGETMIINGYSWTDETSKTTASTRYIQVTKTKEFAGNNYSLDFGSPFRIFNQIEVSEPNSETGDITLYGRFWKGYLRDRFSEEAKMKTCWVNITLGDVQSDLFNKFIFINDTVWVVSKIYNYNPVSYGPTKVDLISVQSIGAYISQKYVEGNLTLARGGTYIYDASDQLASSSNPVIIREDSLAKTITLSVNCSLSWSILSVPEGITITPLTGAAGTRNLSITLPANNTGLANIIAIPLQWGNTTTIIQIVQVSNWTVTAGSTPVGTATINNLASPQDIEDGETVTFRATAPDGYGFLYWIVNYIAYTTQELTYIISEDTNAVANWYDTSLYLKLYCDDDNTEITGETKIENFWLLEVGKTYTFTNTQENLSGYKFNSDDVIINPASSFTKSFSADDTLTVYYDSLIANVTVVNNSNKAFDSNNVIITTPSGAPVTIFGVSVPAGEQYTGRVIYPNAEQGTYTIASTEPEGQTVDINPDYIDYSVGIDVPTIIVTVETEFFPELSIDPIFQEVGANVTQYNIDLKCNSDWRCVIDPIYDGLVNVSPLFGTGDTTVRVTTGVNTSSTERVGVATFETTFGENDVFVNHTVRQRPLQGKAIVNITNTTGEAIDVSVDIIGQIIRTSDNTIVDEFTITSVPDGNTNFEFDLPENSYTVKLSSYTGATSSGTYSILPASEQQLDVLGGKTVGITYGIGSATSRTLVLTPEAVSVGALLNNFTLQVACNSDLSWNITDNANWLSCSPTSGTGPATINVTVAANLLGNRQGRITVTSTNGTPTLTDWCDVSQTGIL